MEDCLHLIRAAALEQLSSLYFHARKEKWLPSLRPELSSSFSVPAPALTLPFDLPLYLQGPDQMRPASRSPP
ncbi:hypothetical protein ACLOJK_012902 [Asimina triloba]